MDDLNDLLQSCGFRSRQEMLLLLHFRKSERRPVDPDHLAARIGIDPLTLQTMLEQLCQAGYLACHDRAGHLLYQYQPQAFLAAKVDELADLCADPLRRQEVEATGQRYWSHLPGRQSAQMHVWAHVSG